MNTTNEYPHRHLPPFRPLVPGEQWHRTDFTPDMLPEGWRPLMHMEHLHEEDLVWCLGEGPWVNPSRSAPVDKMNALARTRRPLPPPPPTFEYDGKTWNSHVPGDPCPVDDNTEVYVLYVDGTVGNGAACDFFWELDAAKAKIGYRIPEVDPVNDTDKLRERMERAERALTSAGFTYTEGAQEWKPPVNVQAAKDNQRIAELEKDKKQLVQDWADDHTHLQKLCLASGYTEPQVYGDTHSTPAIQDLADMLKARISELEQQLAAALTPRPIAEAGPVNEGLVRVYGCLENVKVWTTCQESLDTHFLDIRLPSPDPRAEYDRAVAEAGGHYEAWLKEKQKGGVK